MQSWLSVRRAPGGGRRRGECEGKSRALARRAVAPDGAVVLLHDAIGDREAETGAAADRLRREERSEDPPQMLGRNSGPRVTGPRDRLMIGGPRGNGRPPAAGHGIPRVEEQIEEDLLQL